MINLILSGINGKMGKAIVNLVSNNDNFNIVAGVDLVKGDLNIPVYDSFDNVEEKADVIIDFSRPSTLDGMLAYATKTNTNLVIASTGYTSEDLLKIVNASNHISIFKASNMSLGVNLIGNLVKQAAAFLGADYDIEIIEQHHNQKVDAPSGTAITLAHKANEAFNDSYKIVNGRSGANCKREQKEISISSVRGGNIVGKHDVLFIGKNEVVTISHEAQSREVFAEGALKAANYVFTKEKGLFDMDNLIKDMLQK